MAQTVQLVGSPHPSLSLLGHQRMNNKPKNEIMRNIKKHKSNGDENRTSAQTVQVRFSHPAASAVAIPGTFNDWRPEATPMVSMGEEGLRAVANCQAHISDVEMS